MTGIETFIERSLSLTPFNRYSGIKIIPDSTPSFELIHYHFGTIQERSDAPVNRSQVLIFFQAADQEHGGADEYEPYAERLETGNDIHP